MMIAAVIAEYNPFHNGHAYQLKEIRRQTGADLILVIDRGRIIAQGNHQELMEHCDMYREVYQSQQEGVGE